MLKDENRINSQCEVSFLSAAIPFAQHWACCRELTVNNYAAWDGSLVKCAVKPEPLLPLSSRTAWCLFGSWCSVLMLDLGLGQKLPIPQPQGVHVELGNICGCCPRLGKAWLSDVLLFSEGIWSLIYKQGAGGKEGARLLGCVHPYLWVLTCERKTTELPWRAWGQIYYRLWDVAVRGWWGMSKYRWQIHYVLCLPGEARTNKNNGQLWTCQCGWYAVSPLKSVKLQLLYK